MSLIKIDNLSFSYAKEPILSNLSLSIESGVFWAIVGPNGAGKSTLIQLIAGLLKPAAGTIHLQDKPLPQYRHKDLARILAMVRQEYVPSFGFTVFETVMMARISRQDFVLFENADDRRIVAESLEMTEVAHLADRTLAQLSGGERQRVFIARALAQDTPILVLDEPTNHLDLKHQVHIFDLLKALQRERKKTLLAVTHDINLAARYCDQLLLLGQGGRYRSGEFSQVLDTDNLREYFGVECHRATLDGRPFFIPLGVAPHSSCG
jgi:iron complex transport system ATP-binding protein